MPPSACTVTSKPVHALMHDALIGHMQFWGLLFCQIQLTTKLILIASSITNVNFLLTKNIVERVLLPIQSHLGTAGSGSLCVSVAALQNCGQQRVKYFLFQPVPLSHLRRQARTAYMALLVKPMMQVCILTKRARISHNARISHRHFDCHGVRKMRSGNGITDFQSPLTFWHWCLLPGLGVNAWATKKRGRGNW